MEPKKEGQLKEEDWVSFNQFIQNFIENKGARFSPIPNEIVIAELIYTLYQTSKEDMEINKKNRTERFVHARWIHLYFHYKFYKNTYQYLNVETNLYQKDRRSIEWAFEQVVNLLTNNTEFRKKTAIFWIIWSQFNVPFPKDFPIDKIKQLLDY